MPNTLSKKCMTKVSVLGSIAALVLSLTTGSALAQQEELEEITVTGSRIARDPNLTGALPVQSVDQQEIQMSGEFAISDVVNDVPALLMSTTSEQSIDSADFADGANILNLRGLGANRTLVLVDGRRHVGGAQGSSAVDVGSIPMRLVERVEVLTGGASAIYGADAVTGVVNFIMKDDFEGFNIDASYGISSEGDGEQTSLTATWGTNFANDRGNFAVSVDYRVDAGLKMSERPGAQYGTGGDLVNPALRFQIGDIGSGTPLFEQFYNYANTGLYHYGLRIPSAADFVADYNSAFPGSPITEADLNPAEMALITRGATAPPRAVMPESTFWLTSGYGRVATGEAFGFTGFDENTFIDLDNDGTSDCLQSWSGYNSTFAPGAVGAIGGCWRITESGQYVPNVDGLIVSAGGGQGFGGDSYDVYRQPFFDFLLPDDKVTVNLMGHFDITDSTTVFGELKYSKSKTDTISSHSFWDLIPGWEGNPFLPPHLQAIVADPNVDGVSITVDPVFFRNRTANERETVRAVVGLEGEFDNSWSYEVSANYGRFERNSTYSNQIIIDRWFAAIDAVTDPGTGDPTCAANIDPLRPPGETPFGIPSYDPGYFSFTPGDGTCVPLNVWSGMAGLTPQAVDWVTTDEWDKLVIDQFVFSAFVTGDSGEYFELPAGPISFAAGLEYRDESSDATFDPWQRGVIPAGAPFPAGTLISEHSGNASLTFRPAITIANEQGGYDVTDVFVEASIPLLSDVALARELTLDLAARQSDYSTIGGTTTWKANLIWAPVSSLALRSTYSEAVRAPNITELFGPQIGATFRPDDPCEASQIAALTADDPALGAATQANCVQILTSIGVDPFNWDPNAIPGEYSFFDPLTASFSGVTGGNPLLQEETAETLTVGFVFQPEFLPGFSLSVDYWDISIADAIESVSSQNIVDGCYIGLTLNAAFCALSEREDDPFDQQFGGFTFLQQSTLNFAAVETSGFDFAARYAFEIGAHGFDITVQGTSVDEINDFENPLDPTFANPELLEINRPDLAGNVFLNWNWGDLQVGWQSQYIGEMLFSGIESETYMTLYGPSVLNDAVWIHDISASYLFNDELMVYGGIKNLGDEKPFITDNAFPASPRGTFFFLGIDWTM